ncbi:uncharacterized protein Tco025E_10066 [Trypanosoma conorhini]|uniref:Receptor-type adenylate cyclase n=1 Tax=Trypanosoma conorhini TaxID=83891 RepID=A0A3R7LDW8_9TRYP|nr:uncharacterized protein Tco025E_10066 [Trypanosoma conorhini]RNE95330.1 hypothetical protein Tco025E_10066 [Trypanosoma conorhini]
MVTVSLFDSLCSALLPSVAQSIVNATTLSVPPSEGHCTVEDRPMYADPAKMQRELLSAALPLLTKSSGLLGHVLQAEPLLPATRQLNFFAEFGHDTSTDTFTLAAAYEFVAP